MGGLLQEANGLKIHVVLECESHQGLFFSFLYCICSFFPSSDTSLETNEQNTWKRVKKSCWQEGGSSGSVHAHTHPVRTLR